MNSKENSTGMAGEATVTCTIPATAIASLSDVIDKTDGLVSKSLAAKHLSAMLTTWLERKFGGDAGKPGPFKDSRTVILHESQWIELQWLVTEVWAASDALYGLVNELDVHATTIVNATYEQRKAVGSAS